MKLLPFICWEERKIVIEIGQLLAEIFQFENWITKIPEEANVIRIKYRSILTLHLLEYN